MAKDSGEGPVLEEVGWVEWWGGKGEPVGRMELDMRVGVTGDEWADQAAGPKLEVMDRVEGTWVVVMGEGVSEGCVVQQVAETGGGV